LAKDKRDFEVRLGFARSLVVSQEMTRAMDELLEIVMRDKSWNDQIARRLFVAILELMTPSKPKSSESEGNTSKGGIELAGHVSAQMDPQAELVSRYRRKLSMALN
jgi:putative thioredoxin